MPWDCVLRYMGNDRYHSFMDLGRLDLAFRLGWVKTIYKNWWAPQVIGCHIRYESPIGLFDQFFLRTYIIRTDGACVWMAHQFEKDGTICSSAISKMVVVSKSRIVPLRKFSNYKGTRQWPFQKSTERLFNNVNAVLKELNATFF
jgi:acyl-CoA thioesterase FadM